MTIELIKQQPIIQHVGAAIGKYSYLAPSMRGIATNLNKIAIPAITLFALSNIPGADGGPLAYAACVAGCAPVISGLAGPAAIACFNWCLLVLPLPGP
jgi:hypothetical protein